MLISYYVVCRPDEFQLQTTQQRPTRSESESDVGSPTAAVRSPLKPSASFSGLRNEDSWTPEPLESRPARNPFIDEDEGEQEELNPIAQQYLIIKGCGLLSLIKKLYDLLLLQLPQAGRRSGTSRRDCHTRTQSERSRS